MRTSPPPAKVGDDATARASSPSGKAGNGVESQLSRAPGNARASDGADVARTIALQQTAGNQAVGGLLRRATGAAARQPAVPNGAEASDPLELDADRKADQIAMRWGAGLADPRDDDGPPADAGEGAPIPPGLRRAAEPVLGSGLADVRVHTGSEAGSWTTALDAMALTVGRAHLSPAAALRGRRVRGASPARARAGAHGTAGLVRCVIRAVRS